MGDRKKGRQKRNKTKGGSAREKGEKDDREKSNGTQRSIEYKEREKEK